MIPDRHSVDRSMHRRRCVIAIRGHIIRSIRQHHAHELLQPHLFFSRP